MEETTRLNTNIPVRQELSKQELFHKKMSTAFVVVGVVSFSLSIIISLYTIKRLATGR